MSAAKGFSRDELATVQHESAVDDRVNLALIQGDLSRLSPNEKRDYYLATCRSLGLNPLTKPFEYLRLNNREILYATKACTEQMRQRHGVSARINAREIVEGCYIVTCGATMPDGRTDEAIGAVAIEGLKGENRANAMMKAETKAKRRVTLSICGLGMLDESEVADIPGAAVVHDPQTGEVRDVEAAHLFDVYTRIVREATTELDVDQAFASIKADVHAGRLTREQGNQLKAAVRFRKSEFAAGPPAEDNDAAEPAP